MRQLQERPRAAVGSTVAALLLLLSGPSTAAPAVQDARYPWGFHELAPGVYAAIQPPESRFDDSNSVIVVDARGALVVDAQNDPDAVRGVIDRVEELGAGPVRYLVDTHWHGDHTQGNALYRQRYGPALTIVGHASLREDIPTRAAADLRQRIEYYDRELPPARQRLHDGIDRQGDPLDEEGRRRAAGSIADVEAWLKANRDARFVPPDLVYREEVLLDRDTPVELLHFRGHTRGDTVVYLPEHRILVAGDLVDAMPFVGHGYPAEWVAALRALLELDVDIVVPGHGPVFRGKEQMEAVLGYLEDLVFQVREAVAAGRTLEETIATVDLTSWRARLATDAAAERFFDQVRDDAVERAWLEATGKSGN